MAEFITYHTIILSIFAIILQIFGTLALSLFSFYGIKISENKDAYIEGVPKVEINKKWLCTAQGGLIALLIGIIVSGIISLNALSLT